MLFIASNYVIVLLISAKLLQTPVRFGRQEGLASGKEDTMEKLSVRKPLPEELDLLACPQAKYGDRCIVRRCLSVGRSAGEAWLWRLRATLRHRPKAAFCIQSPKDAESLTQPFAAAGFARHLHVRLVAVVGCHKSRKCLWPSHGTHNTD